jgi:hypothetical protein
MLTIRCAACKRKLWKYDKVGKGEVLRCHKSRISSYEFLQEGEKVKCVCGKIIGINKVYKDGGQRLYLQWQYRLICAASNL